MTRRQTIADLADELAALPVRGVWRGPVAVQRTGVATWRVVTRQAVVPVDTAARAAYLVVMEGR